MSIENVQKERFLETIYKIYYSLGSEPTTNEISTIYGRYFSRYKPGLSIPVPYDDLSSTALVDFEKLNRLLVHTAFNIDVIYDSYFDEIENLYSLISAFKFRIDNLKNRRAELEKKVDDYLFSINNTDGFYFSHTNAFNDTSLTDLNNTTGVVDTLSRKFTIPKLNSGLFNYVGNILSKTSNASVELFVDSVTKKTSQNVDFSNVFNGLNNSEWSYKYGSPSIGVCTLKITIPIPSIGGSVNGISLVEGKINSKKPVEATVVVIDPQDRTKSLSFNKDSSTDYDNFSFNFSTKTASSVEIYLTKVEPDYTDSTNGALLYYYDFRIEELIITAPYYDASATFVSQPITLPVEQNPNLVIDSISFDADDQVPSGTSINYYIAADDGASTDINSFNWVAISPSSAKDPKNKSVIDFKSTSLVEANIVNYLDKIESTKTTMVQIPKTMQFGNPIKNYFYANDSAQLNFNLYRLAKFEKNIDPYEAYMLENVDSNQLISYIVSGSSLDRATWQQVISGTRTDIVPTTIKNTIGSSQEFYQAQNIPYGSIYLKTNIYLQESFTITKNFLKSLSAQYWDVKVYLNGVELSAPGTLSPGVLSSSLTWNFQKGQNSIIVIINKSTNDTSGVGTSFNGSISLMEGISLKNIPNSRLYENYLSYVKVEDLRNIHSNNDNVFSIINWENNKEIVYRRTKEISPGTRVYYYTNNALSPNSVRVRADMFRGNDSYSAPAIVSYTLKFKH
jgi:hypothetical protein